MSFAGHTFDMINRMKFNNSQKKNRLKRIQRLKELYLEEVEVYKGLKIHEKEVSETELNEIKNKIRKRITLENRNRSVKTFLVTILILAFLVYLFV